MLKLNLGYCHIAPSIFRPPARPSVNFTFLLLGPFRNQIFDAFLTFFWTHFNAIS